MTVSVSSANQFVLITTNQNSNTNIKNYPIVIAASINKKPYVRGTNSTEIEAEYINYESYYSFNEYPFLRIDMSESNYLGTYPATIYISFYNYGEYSLPQVMFTSLDFQPSATEYSQADTTCINSCNGRSSNSNVCSKGICTCNTNYSGEDCWMQEAVQFTTSLNGKSTSVDLISYQPKVFFVKKKDIADFGHTTYFFHISESFKDKKYYEKIETRWGINSMVHNPDNVIMTNYIYQRNYPKSDGNALNKMFQRQNTKKKDYVVPDDNDLIYFGFRNIYEKNIDIGFETLERGTPLGLIIMIP